MRLVNFYYQPHCAVSHYWSIFLIIKRTFTINDLAFVSRFCNNAKNNKSVNVFCAAREAIDELCHSFSPAILSNT